MMSLFVFVSSVCVYCEHRIHKQINKSSKKSNIRTVRHQQKSTSSLQTTPRMGAEEDGWTPFSVLALQVFTQNGFVCTSESTRLTEKKMNWTQKESKLKLGSSNQITRKRGDMATHDLGVEKSRFGTFLREEEIRKKRAFCEALQSARSNCTY